MLGDARREGALGLYEPVFEEALHQLIVYKHIVGGAERTRASGFLL
jgi:hypothetical protein